MRRSSRVAFLLTIALIALPAAAASAQSPATGPGGPILVVTNPGDPYGGYYAEILRAEGLNEFAVTDVSQLSAATLSGHQVVVLAQTALSAAQTSVLSAWVEAGGDLIAMRARRAARRSPGSRGGRGRPGRGLPEDRHDLGAGCRPHRRDAAVPRYGRPLVARRRAAGGDAVRRRERGDGQPGGDTAPRRLGRR